MKLYSTIVMVMVLALLSLFDTRYLQAMFDKKSIVQILATYAQEDQQLRCDALKGSYQEQEKIWQKINEVNQTQCDSLKQILEQHGWPSLSKFDEQTCCYAWLIVQHADYNVDFQEQCLNLMLQLDFSEINSHNIAYLHDRVRINRNKKQLYGTQLDSHGKPFEIEDPEKVDIRRLRMRLGPLERYIKQTIEMYQSISNTYA